MFSANKQIQSLAQVSAKARISLNLSLDSVGENQLFYGDPSVLQSQGVCG